MKHYSIRFVFLYFLLTLTFIISPASGEDPAALAEMQASNQHSNSSKIPVPLKTLGRRFDPVIVTGDLLSGLHGLKIENLRLLAHNGNRLNAIPFQIDERDPDGEFIFTDGKLAGTDEDNGLFDYNDELVFMAKDTGTPVPASEWTNIGNKGVEIKVIDPLETSKKGWAYLIHFPEKPPPLSEEDYVSYYPEEEVIRSANYSIGYIEGSPFYSKVSCPKEAGGNGEDFFDRVKMRVQVKTFFNLISISKTEGDLRAEVIGWKDGPVRVLRNIQNYFRIFFKLAEPSLFSVNEYYSHFMYLPIRLTIPFNLKWVFNSFGISGWTWTFYGDIPGLKGGKVITNKNPDGFTFTGNHSREYFEKNLDMSSIVWGFGTKEGVGSWFPCLVVPEILTGILSLYVVDDESLIDPPEDVPGVMGAGVKADWKGVNEDLWYLLARGTYELALDSYFPRPGFTAAEVDEWLNIRNFPLSVDIYEMQDEEIQTVALSDGGKEEASNRGETGRKKKKDDADRGFCGILTDNRDRKFSLCQLHFYIGSYRVTPRTFLAGMTISDKNYHRPEFEDIKRIENRIEDIDPLTGVKYPMFQKLIMRDGTTLDMLGCKPCGFGGRLPDGKKIFFWNTQVRSVEFEE